MAVEFTVEHKRTAEYRFLPENVKINPHLNGRFDTPDIEWLINDILLHGQHTPVVIRNDGGQPVLVAGFSRWRAVSEINKRGLTPIPIQLRATYVKVSEAEAFLMNISENRFRNQVTPIDDAHNIKRLLNVYAMTEQDVAAFYFPTAKTEKELKEAAKFVKDRIALISLTPEAVKAVQSGRVKENAATAIARMSADQQKKILSKGGETITRKDVLPAKSIKYRNDPELVRRAAAVVNDVRGGIENGQHEETLDVTRKLLVALSEYLQR